MNCPHCSKPVFQLSKDGARLKAPTSMLILHKSGDVEINCKHCKMGVLVPLKAVEAEKMALKKARGAVRFFVPRGS